MATPEEEDFTFPATTTDPPPRFIESPPLWWRSFPSTSGHVKSKNLKAKEVQGEESKFTWSSFQEFKASIISQRKSSPCSNSVHEKEEKMDMLWEDLNEELSTSFGKTARIRDNTLSTGTQVQIRRADAKALKLSKANGDMLSGKKPSIVVVINVLKKVLAMRNSRRSIKKRG